MSKKINRWKYFSPYIIATLLTVSAIPTQAGMDKKDNSRVMKGIDVSHFSGEVDWKKVKTAGYSFAFAKATEGVDLLDPVYQNHWETIKKVGLIRGAYHFYVTEDDPEEQAKFFISNANLRPGDYVPAIDIEAIGHGTKPGLVERFKKFLAILETHYGAKPIIYTSPKFWNKHLDKHFGTYPLWIAEYGVDKPIKPRGWKEWHLWQWRENADVPGVEKGADLTIFNTNERDFEILLIKQLNKIHLLEKEKKKPRKRRQKNKLHL